MLTPDQRPSLTDWRDNPRQRGHQKYRNVRCVHQGMTFDSKAELKRWLDLSMLLKAREIKDLRRQVPYLLIPKTARPSGGHERECTYIADFVYVDRNGRTVVEDVKGGGLQTDVFTLKRKLMLFVHGIEIRVVKT